MLPLARTNEEAHLYMEFASMRLWRGRVRRQQLGVAGGRCLGCAVRGAMPGVWRTRVFEFRQPEELVLPGDDAWAVGDQPSQLLDAGEWLYVADGFGGDPADPTGLSAVERERVCRDLRAAAGAIDEVLKFLPPGADQVPDTAFWSPRGRRVREAEPGRFRRLRLEAGRDMYRRLAAELTGERQ